jgi:hypothetical protein
MLNLDTTFVPMRPVIRYHCAFCSWVGTLRERCPDHWPPAQTRTQRLRLLRTRHGYRLPPYPSTATQRRFGLLTLGVGLVSLGSVALWWLGGR